MAIVDEAICVRNACDEGGAAGARHQLRTSDDLARLNKGVLLSVAVVRSPDATSKLAATRDLAAAVAGTRSAALSASAAFAGGA